MGIGALMQAVLDRMMPALAAVEVKPPEVPCRCTRLPGRRRGRGRRVGTVDHPVPQCTGRAGIRVPPILCSRLLRATLATGALATGLALPGCGGVVDVVVETCVDFDGPELVTEALPGAALGQPYAATLTVELVREPYDDDFAYDFRIDGPLPPGLQVTQVGRERRIEIRGTPNAIGEFDFTVSVSVREPGAAAFETPVLCWTDAARDYRVVVVPGPG